MNRKQYRLRTLLLWTLVAGVILAALGTKLRQNEMRRKAFLELAVMGFRSSVGDPGGLQFRYERSQALSDDNAELAIHHLQTLRKRHDLGLSPGDKIGLVSFEGSRQDEGVIQLFRERFPTAAVCE